MQQQGKTSIISAGCFNKAKDTAQLNLFINKIQNFDIVEVLVTNNTSSTRSLIVYYNKTTTS